MRWVFLLILAVRVCNVLTIKTFFQADEYYQALEPAYYFVFGNGVLTWEWEHRLRSFIHPAIFSVVYEICKIFNLGDAWVRVLPKILQAVLSSVGEYHIFLLALKLTHRYKAALVTIALSLTSPFNWYFITRTFSNNLEMILTAVALNYFPLKAPRVMSWRSYVVSLVLALISCVIRPTNAFIWVCLGVDLLLRVSNSFQVLFVTSAVVVLVLAANTLADYAFYKELTFPIWNFIEFNVLSSLSSFYGISSLSFYFVQAVPVIMTTYLPFLLVGISKVLKGRNVILKKILFISVADIFLFSLISHKEFRFIYPLMPFFMVFSGLGYTEISSKFKKWNLILPLILLLNFGISFYMVQIHERGVIDVVDYLKTQARSGTTIGFLTPCHSTPSQSYFNFHDDSIQVWSLSCEPPLEGQELSTYKDESDIFYEDPVKFLSEDLPYSWPDYIVIFEALSENTKVYLKDIQHYKMHAQFFNSRAHWDSRRKGDVIVLSRF